MFLDINELARPVCLDQIDEAAGTGRHHADAVRQHRRFVQRVGDQQHGGPGFAP